MPLALDLISALESGWILPVATTTRARSPRSTEASLDGSISWLGLSAALTPKPAPRITTSAMEPQMMRRRRFLPFFPLVKPLPMLDMPETPTSNYWTPLDTGPNHERFRSTAKLDERIRDWSDKTTKAAPLTFPGEIASAIWLNAHPKR